MASKDLNKLEDSERTRPENFTSGNVAVITKNLAAELVEVINAYPVVLGCIAWLTNKRILDALASREHVSIVVQKEDFLRPDRGFSKNYKGSLRTRYDKLPGKWAHWDLGENVCSQLRSPDSLFGVRCVGEKGARGKTTPRMHHKFAVFGRVLKKYKRHEHKYTGFYTCSENCDKTQDPCGGDFQPELVWTGSFNWTENATASFENAVIISDPAVAAGFHKEWVFQEQISEPLDWEAEYVCPEWRVGT